MKRQGWIVLVVLLSVALTACETKRDTGTIAGGAAGAIIGSELGGTTGTIIGALGGAFLGREVGKYLDERDRGEVAEALERQQTGESRAWTNPDTGRNYEVTPTETFSRDGRPCRRFVMEVEDEDGEVAGVACRTASGNWEIVE